MSFPASILLLPYRPFTGPSAFKRVSSSAVNISGAVISISSSVLRITFFEKIKFFFPLFSRAVSEDKNKLVPLSEKTSKTADLIKAVSFSSVETI